MNYCKFCGEPIHLVIGPHQEQTWVDDTDGDGCGDNILEDGKHGSHAPPEQEDE